MLRIMPLATVGVVLFAFTLGLDAVQKTPPRTNSTAATLKEFTRRVEEYVALHKKLEDSLPRLPKQTDPVTIDKHQRALALLFKEARKSAKPGDIFFPDMQQLVRTLLRPIFRGTDGQQIKNEILDKEYKDVKLVANGRYPDEVPISTVPPQVLAQLPKLEEELEYRFIKTNMILFDSHAHLIVDFVERAFQ
jgi:hypothetical protein